MALLEAAMEGRIMRRRKLASILTTLAIVGASIVGASIATATSASAKAPPSTQICQTDRGQLCANRNGGGNSVGTKVIGWFHGDQNNNFEILWLDGACGDGHVHASQNCPDFGGTRLSLGPCKWTLRWS